MSKINRLLFLLSSIFLTCLFGYGCSKDLDFNSETILGSYDGKLIFQWPDKVDTLLEVQVSYDFFSDGSLVFTNTSNLEKDTSEWYLNESAKKLTIQSKFFFGTSINDVIVYNEDSLIFEGLIWVNITGSPNEYRRIAELERIR